MSRQETIAGRIKVVPNIPGEETYEKLVRKLLITLPGFNQRSDPNKPKAKSIAVIGSRSFDNYPFLKNTLDNLRKSFLINEIVSGGAKGADSLAEEYAREKLLRIKVFHPDWNKHGRAAGILRNAQIVKASDFIVAFWDGESPGTKNSLSEARKLKKHTLIIYV